MRVLAGVATLLCACGTSPQRPPSVRVEGVARPIEEARTLLGELRARDEAVHSFKAVHVLEIEDRARDREASLQGVLVARRPDSFRLRLLGPAGVTAMDLVYVAPRYRLDVIGREPVRSDDARAERRLPVHAMAQAFLRRHDGEPVELRAGAERRSLVLRTSPRERRTLVLPRTSTDVLIDSVERNGKEELRVTYADYRDVAGGRLPFRIRMDLPEREVTAKIEVERYEVEPEIPTEMFEI